MKVQVKEVSLPTKYYDLVIYEIQATSGVGVIHTIDVTPSELAEMRVTIDRFRRLQTKLGLRCMGEEMDFKLLLESRPKYKQQATDDN